MIRLSRTEERVPLRGTRRASYGAARRTLPPIVLSSTIQQLCTRPRGATLVASGWRLQLWLALRSQTLLP